MERNIGAVLSNSREHARNHTNRGVPALQVATCDSERRVSSVVRCAGVHQTTHHTDERWWLSVRWKCRGYMTVEAS